MKRLGESLLETDNPPIQALFVYASNPAASVPNQNKVFRGLARNGLFTVIVEHFLTDTARYADIVLPATMQTEHRDLLIAYGHLYIAWNEPAVLPPGECLPTTEIFRGSREQWVSLNPRSTRATRRSQLKFWTAAIHRWRESH